MAVHFRKFSGSCFYLVSNKSQKYYWQLVSLCAFFRYRLAPEFHYPIPLEDTLKATKYFLNNTHLFNIDPQRVAIVGKFYYCARFRALKCIGKTALWKLHAVITSFEGTSWFRFLLDLFSILETNCFWINSNLHFNIVGDSAGGNLATAVAMILRDTNFHPQPKLQVLLYPALQAVDFHTPSYHIGKNLLL